MTQPPAQCECKGITFADMQDGGWRCVNCKRVYIMIEPESEPPMPKDPDRERCPHCQQRMPKPQTKRKFDRICRKCEEPIRTHHKWKIETDGKMSWFEHRHCDNPDSYSPLHPTSVAKETPA